MNKKTQTKQPKNKTTKQKQKMYAEKNEQIYFLEKTHK